MRDFSLHQWPQDMEHFRGLAPNQAVHRTESRDSSAVGEGLETGGAADDGDGFLLNAL